MDPACKSNVLETGIRYRWPQFWKQYIFTEHYPSKTRRLWIWNSFRHWINYNFLIIFAFLWAKRKFIYWRIGDEPEIRCAVKHIPIHFNYNCCIWYQVEYASKSVWVLKKLVLQKPTICCSQTSVTIFPFPLSLSKLGFMQRICSIIFSLFILPLLILPIPGQTNLCTKWTVWIRTGSVLGINTN